MAGSILSPEKPAPQPILIAPPAPDGGAFVSYLFFFVIMYKLSMIKIPPSGAAADAGWGIIYVSTPLKLPQSSLQSLFPMPI
jgi:hypothetical protein